MAKRKIIVIECEDEEPFFDFGAWVVAFLLLGGCAFGGYAAFIQS